MTVTCEICGTIDEDYEDFMVEYKHVDVYAVCEECHRNRKIVKNRFRDI